MNILHTFAATYDCSTYGNGSYNSVQDCGTVTDTTSGLANTGMDIYLGVGAGIILIAVAIVLLMRRRSVKKTRP